MAYEASLHELFDRLVDFPDLGRAVQGAGEGTRLAFESSHVIVYRTEPIRILRVLHQAQDWMALIEGD